jgi:hypothetical protein
VQLLEQLNLRCRHTKVCLEAPQFPVTFSALAQPKNPTLPWADYYDLVLWLESIYADDVKKKSNRYKRKTYFSTMYLMVKRQVKFHFQIQF